MITKLCGTFRQDPYTGARNGVPVLILSLSCLTLILSTEAFAQSNQWTGAISGDFSNAGNWSTGAPTGSNVVIGSTGTNRPTATGVNTVGTMTVGGTATNAGTLTSSAVTVQTTGILTNSGTLTSTAVTKNSGTISNTTGTINGGVTNLAGSTLANSGTINGGIVNMSTGVVLNSGGTITGGLTNLGSVRASGTVNGDILNNDGALFQVMGATTGNKTLTNKGQVEINSRLSGLTSVTNSSTSATGFVIQTGGSLSTGTLTNAAGATITNNGQITTTSPIANAGTIANNATGSIDNGIANTGTVANAGLISKGVTNSATGILTNALTGIINDGITNNGGKVSNAGTVNDAVINNSGLFDNTGKLKKGITVVDGHFTSTATTSVVQGGLTNSAISDIAGVLEGPVVNKSGGTITIMGNTIGSGTVENQSGATVALTGGNLLGRDAFDNAGTVTATGARTLGTSGFNNQSTGVVSLSNGAANDSLLINGPYTGAAGSRLVVDIDVTKTPAPTSRADTISINGLATGTSSVSINTVGKGGLLSAPVDVLTVAPGSSLTLNTGLISQKPYVNYYLQESSPGSGVYQVASQLNSAPLNAITASLANGIMSLNGALQTPLYNALPKTERCSPGQGVIAPFINAVAGQDRYSGSTSGSASGGQGDSSPTRSTQKLGGFQGGIDMGLCNAGDSQWNIHAGLMGGQVSAGGSASSSTSGLNGFAGTSSQAATKIDMPFFGLYGMAINGGFKLEVQARRDIVNAGVTVSDVNNTYTTQGQKVKGSGWNFSGLAAYRIAMPGSLYIEPHLGVSTGSVRMSSMQMATGKNDTLTMGNVDTSLFRAGVNLGISLLHPSGIVVSPFAHLSVVNPLSKEVSSTAKLESIDDNITVKTSNGGGYGQVGGGVQFRSLGGGFSGFARGDFKFGKVQGQAFNAGVRLQF